jgi:tetratricopeptide (TPR) repeat protein
MYTYQMIIHNARKLALAAGVSLMATMGTTALMAQTPPGDPSQARPRMAALREQLFQALKQAQSEQEARGIEDQIWLFWMQGPDEQATREMAAILAARRAYDNEKALSLADALIARLPDYAEGWNQKATVLFAMDDLDGSLEAIQHVLGLEPKHFGSLAGKAVILMRQGRAALAQDALKAAVEIDPFLKERVMLAEPPGQPI